MTDAGEVKRRIQAARILRKMSQTKMDERGVEFGLDRQELSRTERGKLQITEARRMVLCKVLQVPDSWFLEEDVDLVVGMKRVSRELMRELLPELVEAARELRPNGEAIQGPSDAQRRRGPAAGDAGA